MAAPCADKSAAESARVALPTDAQIMEMILRLRRRAFPVLPCGAQYEPLERVDDWKHVFTGTDEAAVRFQRTCLAYGIEIIATQTNYMSLGSYLVVYYIHCAPGFDKDDDYRTMYRQALTRISAWRRVMADNGNLLDALCDSKIAIPDSKPYEPEWRPRGCPFYWAEKPPVAK